MVSFNPACYLPASATQFVPSSIACPPPSSYLRSTYEAITSPLGSTFTALKAGMDALMSLPLLSFLLIPTMTSYSTSLNLLFFYLTWSTLILSHPPLRVEIVASLAIKILFYILPSALFLLCDILFPGIAVSFKSLGSTALPFKNLSRRKAHEKVKLLGWSLVNILLSIAVQAVIELTLVTLLEHKSALKITTTLPLPWAIVKDLLRGFLFRDSFSYVIHKYLLHSPGINHITRDLTRLHTNWYHAQVRAPFPFSATYDHPLAYILRSFIPVYLPAYIWRFHLLTYILFQILISLEETFTFSGYIRIPTNFVLGGIARRNEAHCLTAGAGNYGTWGLIDWLIGDNIGSDVLEELILEIEEANVREKAEKRVLRGVRKFKGLTRNEDVSFSMNGVENGVRSVLGVGRIAKGGGSGTSSGEGRRRTATTANGPRKSAPAKDRETLRNVSGSRERTRRRTRKSTVVDNDSDYED